MILNDLIRVSNEKYYKIKYKFKKILMIYFSNKKYMNLISSYMASLQS